MMGDQCVNLYENVSVQGSLFIDIDNSKFVLHFYDSVKVEMCLTGNIPPAPKTQFNEAETTVETPMILTPSNADDLTEYNGNAAQNVVLQNDESARFNSYNYIGDTQTAEIFENSSSSISKENKVFESNEALVAKNGNDLVYANVETKCGTSNKTEIDLNQVETSSELSVHSCGYCFNKFDTWEAYKDHKLVKVTEEFACKDCGEVFPFKAYLQVHRKTNHGNVGASIVFKNDHYWYSCDICGVLVTTINNLQTHTLVHTNENVFKFQCCLCPKVFKEKTHLSDHLRGHKKSEMIECRKCNQFFESKSSLAKHKLECREVKCHICNIDFPNRTSRNHHYKDFHPNDILKCHLCTHLFSSKEELNSHIEKHSLLKKKQCTICGLFFSRVKKHMLKHKSHNELSENDFYFCDKCPAKFTNQATFSRHMKNHLGEKLYHCPHCPRSFSNCGALYKHIKRHSVLFPYTCEMCGENCASLENLKSHLLTHEDKKYIRFPCDICSQVFLYRGTLETHIQLKHPQAVSDNTETPLCENTVPLLMNSNLNEKQDNSQATNNSVPADNSSTFLNDVIPGIVPELMSGRAYKFVIVEK